MWVMNILISDTVGFIAEFRNGEGNQQSSTRVHGQHRSWQHPIGRSIRFSVSCVETFSTEDDFHALFTYNPLDSTSRKRRRNSRMSISIALSTGISDVRS